MTTSTTCSVDPVVVLYAIRYGLPRATAAHDDALALIQNHWPLLQDFRHTIIADLEDVVARPDEALSSGERQRVAALLDRVRRS